MSLDIVRYVVMKLFFPLVLLLQGSDFKPAGYTLSKTKHLIQVTPATSVHS